MKSDDISGMDPEIYYSILDLSGWKEHFDYDFLCICCTESIIDAYFDEAPENKHYLGTFDAWTPTTVKYGWGASFPYHYIPYIALVLPTSFVALLSLLLTQLCSF